MAALMGVNVGAIYTATFALGSGLAAVCGRRWVRSFWSTRPWATWPA